MRLVRSQPPLSVISRRELLDCRFIRAVRIVCGRATLGWRRGPLWRAERRGAVRVARRDHRRALPRPVRRPGRCDGDGAASLLAPRWPLRWDVPDTGAPTQVPVAWECEQAKVRHPRGGLRRPSRGLFAAEYERESVIGYERESVIGHGDHVTDLCAIQRARRLRRTIEVLSEHRVRARVAFGCGRRRADACPLRQISL
jgi:hypothetical protein